ncbi:DNA polymerase IV [Guptibacillus algicola]|uniref:DNA polymerase IV n=1 Tax=Guptibacillus algicola TaxID=225844 RepID=UPI001CD31C9F|nr:DNA polymerase IV [Alkalihalobacillus algicola]MCA0985942.1 DNA polymerase IV [Alkalihalobacillus algicola]
MNKQTGGRIIFHVDMNSFYASVEVAHNPELRGKPLAIAGNVEERKGIVVTSSYEARKMGVKTTMPLWEARKHCPGLLVMPPNFPLYRRTSLQIFELLESYTPLVQPVSIDEGYLDVTDDCRGKNPVAIAEEIQKRIFKEIGIPCSIGIAPNKFLAKMASDMKKPLGITILRKRQLAELLWPLDVGEMHGVGKKTKEKLNELKIKTIGDLAEANPVQLELKLGINGKRLHARANGIDDRPVDPDAIDDFKSVGNSSTFPEDLVDRQRVYTALTNLSDSVAKRMEQKGVLSFNVQLTIRYSDRTTITRSRKLENPISKSADILEAAKYLFSKNWTGQPIRLLGITGQQLVDRDEATVQLDLFSFEKDSKRADLYDTIGSIRKKFGESSLLKGNQLNKDGSHKLRDEKRRGTSLDRDFLWNYKNKK